MTNPLKNGSSALIIVLEISASDSHEVALIPTMMIKRSTMNCRHSVDMQYLVIALE